MDRALELAPGNAGVLYAAAAPARNLGRVEESIGLYRRALEQDPLSSRTCHNLGIALHCAGRFEESEAACRKSLEPAPQSTGTRAWRSLALLALNRGEEARAEAIREPDPFYRAWASTIVHHGLGHAAESDTALQELVERHSEDGTQTKRPRSRSPAAVRTAGECYFAITIFTTSDVTSTPFSPRALAFAK